MSSIQSTYRIIGTLPDRLTGFSTARTEHPIREEVRVAEAGSPTPNQPVAVHRTTYRQFVAGFVG